MHFYLKKENARRDQLMAAQGYTLESYTEEMKEAEREKGDNATVSCSIPSSGELYTDIVAQFFRYTT